ncbi:MAG: hypothetical protein L0229_31065, partial [Blastocatellia bacterium]|nr:hypothetical protein [Blastocatellia bacterium]
MKVTRTVKSKNITKSKLERLRELAARLGVVRKSLWQQYGGLKNISLTHRDIRDKWIQTKPFNIPARLWKETLRDILRAGQNENFSREERLCGVRRPFSFFRDFFLL